MPPGSNRSGIIDSWNTAASAPLASAWCASFALAAWRAGSVAIPAGFTAACETIHQVAAALGRFVSVPDIGDIALYDFGSAAGYADHCGIVIRTAPTVLTVEGNTNDSGGNEGVGVFLHDRHGGRLLGYVSLGLS